MSELMKNGTQIIYFPPHVTFGDVTHRDVEFGFVYDNSMHYSDAMFCRYWSRQFPSELRTKSCGELTPRNRLFVKDTRDQELVWKEIRNIVREYKIRNPKCKD